MKPLICKNIFKTESSGGQTYEMFLDKGVTSHLFLHDEYEAASSSYRQSFIETSVVPVCLLSHSVKLTPHTTSTALMLMVKPG